MTTTVSLTLLIVLAQLLLGADPAPDTAFYQQEVQPLLKERCYSCHSHSAKKMRGGLAVDSREALLAGGDSGPALVPGQPGDSLLIDAVKRTGLEMPPAGKGEPLTVAEIAVLERWIQAGAPAPESVTAAGPRKRRPGAFTDEDRKWWALQPLRATEPPGPSDRHLNPIDRFLAARLQLEGLSPAPRAKSEVLVRRLTFDLTGLPPTPEQRQRSVNTPAEWEAFVDELLASPAFGERMARAWLDLVRYADSDGYRIDDYRPDSWRYRDYVIRAFNTDKPYDRFVQEQLAGDELFPDDPEALIATGYLRHGIYEYNNRDVRGQWTTILNDITDTTGDVFFGLGLQCARCHDHKFDPLLQRDYYRLQAFFAPIQPREDLIAATAAQRAAWDAADATWREKAASVLEQIARLEQSYRDRAAEDAITKFPDDLQVMIRKPAAERTPLESQLVALAWRQVEYEWGRLDGRIKGTDKEKLIALRKQLAEFDAMRPAPLPRALAVSDVGPTAPVVTIPKRGDDPIEPGFVSLLDPGPADVVALPQSPATTGRRAALARWLTRPDNPLSARIIVNRVWQQHFGRGLAPNTSDFGMLGEPPSHPELLDWLADRFLQDGWSLKKLHRMIVTSAAFQQSSEHPDPGPGRLRDPENKWLWRHVPRRLDAEQIRDALFQVSGELRREPAGGPGSLASEPRRTIYTRFLRNTRDPLADVFDAPLWFASAASRDTTTTPVQSLLLINSPFLLQRSRSFAQRLQSQAPGDEPQQLTLAFQVALGRSPHPDELAAAAQFLAEQRARIDQRRATSAQAAFAAEKIPYRDGQAALIEPRGAQRLFRADHSEAIQPEGDFTIEAFIQPRTIADDGTVRVIAAKWTGDLQQPGWCLGITGKGSRRKPQTVVFQAAGRRRDGSFGEVVAFSDHHIAMNKPYFLGASVRLATADARGSVTFTLKDLSNDDEPLLTARVEHALMSGIDNSEPFTIGGRTGRNGSHFHGAIDDVRLSRGSLDAAQLLINVEAATEATCGYWRFEARPDVLHDLSEHRRHLIPALESTRETAAPSVLADFCHALLNSSEFLYVE